MRMIRFFVLLLAVEWAQATVMFRGKEVTRDEAASALLYTEKIAVAKTREEKTNLRHAAEEKKVRTDAGDAVRQVEADRLKAIKDTKLAAKAKIAADKKAFVDRKAATHKSESAVNEFASRRDSYTHRLGPEGNRFQLRSKASDPEAYRFGTNTKAYSPGNKGFCMTVPDAAKVKGGWRNGLAVTMAPCDAEDELQLFSFDPVSSYIHPEPTRSWCLDYAASEDTDPKGFKSLRVQWCDKKWDESHGDAHQKWTVANNSHVRNEDTKWCATTGLGDEPGRVFTGKTVQQHKCDSGGGALEQFWTWLPKGAYKAMELNRL